MVSKAQIEAQARYDAKNTIQYHLKLNTITDDDIIKKLNDVKNKQGYIKDLIRKDITKSLEDHKAEMR